MEILKEIESLLNVKIENELKEKNLDIRNFYKKNKKNEIIHLNLVDANDSNFEFLILILKRILRLESLNLSNCTITSINHLSVLTTLKHLDLSQISFTDLSPISKLKELISLNLNSITINDFSCLENLPNLKSLQINSAKNLDVNQLENLKNLTRLHLNNNSLTDISFLNKLKKIKALYLLNNKITNIEVLKNLKYLSIINLGKNNIKDISPLKENNKLTTLWLIGNNSINNLSIIANLTNLTGLSIGTCNIKGISYLKNSTNLIRLDIQDNQIQNINPLKYLTNLTHLDLGNNNIKDITSLKKLKKLNHLELQKNPINNVPHWITDFEMNIQWNQFNHKDGFITFFENPIKNIPLEIIKQGKQAIKRYFEKIAIEGSDFIYEVKVTLVGEGNAGKTSLLRRLINEKSSLPRKDKRTRGIDIKNWHFKNDNRKHIAHIWDFGGQDVYYPVHRFFITKNSVFILLASTRQTHHHFDYWIPTIYQFGGDSPIILGQTCHDGSKKPWSDLGVYIGNDNFNIIKTQVLPYTEINLLDENFGLKKIKKIIIDQIENLPHYGRKVPKSWAAIRNKLASYSKSNPCISYEKFKDLCVQASPSSFQEEDDFTDCCRFLHNIGVVLWYFSTPELKNWIILEPQWAMNAVYMIIDDKKIQSRKGHIISSDFDRLWISETYKEKHLVLKKMLEVFKISFPKKHKKQDYIIPARLNPMPIDDKFKNNESYLCLEYYFEFMPKGIVNQLSAELSKYINNDASVWNNAVNFTFESKTIGQVEEDFYNRKILIKIKGKDSRSLMILIKDSLENITNEYRGVYPKIKVPCSCSSCKSQTEITKFDYNKLIDWSNNRGDNASVTCNESQEKLLIKELLYSVGLNQNQEDKTSSETPNAKKVKKIFISYSKHDKDYLQDFQEHLVTLKSEGIATFDCRAIDLGEKWDDTIKKEIDECDIMVCLVSVKFLNTDYITKIEIPKAIEQNKIIVPIIIKSCDWENSELGKYQAAQRGKIVSLDNELGLSNKIKSVTDEEKAAFWTSVIKEFRSKLFN